MKKILAFVLVLVLGIGMASMPGFAEETVTLTFLSWQNETTLQPILDAFAAAYPNIKIDLQYAPPVNDYVEKFRLLVTSNELPDIFVTAAENKLEVMEGGLAMDLSGLAMVSRLSAVNKSTYTDPSGKLVAIAPDAWIASIFYNKKLLEDNGIAVPTNYEEYIASFKALQDAGVAPWVFNANNLYDPLQGYVATETIAKDRDYDAKVDAGKLTYKDGWSTPMQLWVKDYVESGVIPEEALGLDGEQSMNAFINGEAAYTVGATWSVVSIDQKNPDLQYGMLPWFGLDGKTAWCTGAAGVGWSINASTKHPEEALTFLEFLVSDDSLKAFQAKTGGLLAVTGIEYNVHPVIAMCIDKLYEGNFYLPAVAWKHSGALGQVMLTGTQEVVMGASTGEDVVQAMDDKWAELEAAQQ